MATQNFDELNILKRRSIPYDEYFADMELTPKQREQRKKTALILEDILSIIFEVMFVQYTMNMINETAVKQQFIYDLYDAIEDDDFFDDEEQFEEYLSTLVDEIVDTTFKNLKEHPNDYDYTGEKPYWVSEDRVQVIAENEANHLSNNKDYLDAKNSGKTHKMWVAFPDDRVRPTHQIVNGAEIPIDSYFEVGRARMLYPMDTTSLYSTGAECPEEVIGCRCQVLYF